MKEETIRNILLFPVFIAWVLLIMAAIYMIGEAMIFGPYEFAKENGIPIWASYLGGLFIVWLTIGIIYFILFFKAD